MTCHVGTASRRGNPNSLLSEDLSIAVVVWVLYINIGRADSQRTVCAGLTISPEPLPTQTLTMTPSSVSGRR
jgi:hypothetical protein